MPSNGEPKVPTLDACHEGMTVVDVHGEELGTIAAVGLPNSDDERTVRPEFIEEYEGPPDPPFPVPGAGGSMLGPADAPLPAGLADRGPTRVGPAEPDVSPELARKLLRGGYVKIDSKGFFHRDRYAGADQIGRVDGDTLHLTATKDDLATRNLT